MLLKKAKAIYAETINANEQKSTVSFEQQVLWQSISLDQSGRERLLQNTLMKINEAYGDPPQKIEIMAPLKCRHDELYRLLEFPIMTLPGQQFVRTVDEWKNIWLLSIKNRTSLNVLTK